MDARRAPKKSAPADNSRGFGRAAQRRKDTPYMRKPAQTSFVQREKKPQCFPVHLRAGEKQKKRRRRFDTLAR
jgi:hypothetical protein